MAAEFVNVNEPLEVALTVALKRLIFGDGIDYVYVNADDDIFVVYDNSLDDGAAVPATARERVPAGTSFAIENNGIRPLICARTGTTTAWLIPYEREGF